MVILKSLSVIGVSSGLMEVPPCYGGYMIWGLLTTCETEVVCAQNSSKEADLLRVSSLGGKRRHDMSYL